jgi:hypothetical protein
VVREEANRPLAVRNDALVHLLVGDLSYDVLCDPQDSSPLGDELVGRQRLVTGPLETDEFRDVFEILAEDIVLAFGNDRNVAYAELEQTLASTCVVEHVDVLVVDAFTRKKLFRPETATSSRLREQYEFFCDGVHRLVPAVEGS